MKIKMNELTRHAKEDRKDRRDIAKQIGIGKPVAEIRRDREGSNTQYAIQMLTDTGLIVIVGDDGKIITLYLATIPQAMAIYGKAHGTSRLPDQLYRQININRTFYAAD